MISYRLGNELDLDAVIELYRASTLGKRRPVDDRERMRQMLANANLVVTAWDGELLVGIARSVSDFSYATYLSDLVVRESHQRQGIGRELIRRTQKAGGQASSDSLVSTVSRGLLPAHRHETTSVGLDTRVRLLTGMSHQYGPRM